MRQVEVNAPRLFRDIFVCAEEDRDFFRHHDPAGRLKLPLIPCGVDPSAYRVAPGTRERVRAELSLSDADRVVVFAASRFGPNVEAFALLERILPRSTRSARHANTFAYWCWVRSSNRRGVKAHSSPPAACRKSAPYFAAADAGLNPVTRGSGANVKIFEYLAARLPVISTVFGVRGTPLRAEQDFLTFDPLQPAQALQRFARERTSAQWRSFADSVWQRHHASCDINELVQLAIALRPEFGLTE